MSCSLPVSKRITMSEIDPILEGMSLLASANEVAEAVEMDLGVSSIGEERAETGGGGAAVEDRRKKRGSGWVETS